MGLFSSIVSAAKTNIKTRIVKAQKRRKMRGMTRKARRKFLFTTPEGQKELYSIAQRKVKKTTAQARIAYLKHQKAQLLKDRPKPKKIKKKRKKIKRVVEYY